MSLERATQPYKLLVSYDEAGALAFVHVQSLDVVKDGGEIISSRPLDPVPLADALADGFPLSAVIALLTAALPA